VTENPKHNFPGVAGLGPIVAAFRTWVFHITPELPRKAITRCHKRDSELKEEMSGAPSDRPAAEGLSWRE